MVFENVDLENIWSVFQQIMMFPTNLLYLC